MLDLHKLDANISCDLFQGLSVSLEEAVAILLDIERVVSPLGAHTALTGSCIYKGSSKDDVDILIYSHTTKNPPNKQVLLDAIKQNLNLGYVNDKQHWYFQTSPHYVDKDVVIINVAGFRVDLFFLL